MRNYISIDDEKFIPLIQPTYSPVYVGKDSSDLIGRITGRSNRNADTLFFNVIGSTNRILYMAPVAELYSSELNLDAGRFEHYSKIPQEYSVVFAPEYSTSGAEFIHLFKERLIWIAEHVTDPWSFAMMSLHVTRTQIMYSFDNLTTAALFRLVWG